MIKSCAKYGTRFFCILICSILALVLANTNKRSVVVDLECLGVDTANTDILKISKAYRYTLTGERIRNNQLSLPPYSCTEIRLYENDPNKILGGLDIDCQKMYK